MNRLLFSLFFMAITFPCYAESRKNRLHMEMSQLATAAIHYKSEYSTFPSGKSIDVTRALTGANPRRIAFIDWTGRSSDPNGRFLDQWSIPFLISFPDSETVTIRSAGPDRIFETSDDKFYTNGSHGVDHNAQ
jgi:hypothetical protein